MLERYVFRACPKTPFSKKFFGQALRQHSLERGDVAIYTALIVVGMMVSGAIALGIILSQQIPRTYELQASERSFYAAVAGREQALFLYVKRGSSDIILDETITYTDGNHSVYKGKIANRNIGGGECADGADNDGDLLADRLDSDCHSDGVTTNDSSYVFNWAENPTFPCGPVNGWTQGVLRRLGIGDPENICPDLLAPASHNTPP